MPRKQTVRTPFFPYHIYARTNNREAFPISMKQAWGVYIYVMQESIKKFEVDIHAFTLMSNHFHIALSTPEANIDLAMHFFMQKTTKLITKNANRINRLYGGRYQWSLITTDKYYACLLRYIYQNPVRAGLCLQVEDYPFNSLKKMGFNLCHNQAFKQYVPEDPIEFKKWLNVNNAPHFNDYMRVALHKKSFKFPRQPNKLPEDGSSFLKT